MDIIKDNFIDEYGENETTKYHKKVNFASMLVESQSFVHFMDGYIHNDLMNFDLANSILYNRGILKKRYKASEVTL